MKKFGILGLFCLLSVKFAFCQQDLLSFDEHNKYIFYQVVDMPGLTADSLHERGLHFLKTAYPKTVIKSAEGASVTGSGKFLTYGGVSVMRHEKGEIAYQFNIELKDQKYRFWLTSFVFTPYQRDRYGNFVPETGVDIPLEEITDKLEKKEAEAYLDEAGAFCKQWGDKLKSYMTRAQEEKKEPAARKVVTDKW